MGRRRLLSWGLSFRLRTSGWFRYATSAIALKTLAHGIVRLALKLYSSVGVRRAKPMIPLRCFANLTAELHAGFHGFVESAAPAAAGTSSEMRRIVTSARRTSSAA